MLHWVKWTSHVFPQCQAPAAPRAPTHTGQHSGSASANGTLGFPSCRDVHRNSPNRPLLSWNHCDASARRKTWGSPLAETHLGILIQDSLLQRGKPGQAFLGLPGPILHRPRNFSVGKKITNKISHVSKLPKCLNAIHSLFHRFTVLQRLLQIPYKALPKIWVLHLHLC